MLNLDRMVSWSGLIDLENGAKITDKVLELYKKDPNEPVHLVVNSVGGNPDVGFAFYDLMTNLQIPLHTFGLGYVASMGVIIFLLGKRRFVGEHTMMVIHENGRTDPSRLSTSALAAADRETVLSQDFYNDIFCKHSNLKRGADLDLMFLRTTVLDPAQMIVHGIAHEMWLPTSA